MSLNYQKVRASLRRLRLLRPCWMEKRRKRVKKPKGVKLKQKPLQRNPAKTIAPIAKKRETARPKRRPS